MELNSIVGFSNGHSQYGKKKIIFDDCSFFASSFSFSYLIACRMSIDDANYYDNFTTIDADLRETLEQRYITNGNSLFKDDFIIYIEMIEPGGEIFIAAKEFKVIDLEKDIN